MAKATKKKPAKEASNLFHNIMAASVKGNPKPKISNVSKAVHEQIAENSNYRVTRFTISPHTRAELVLKATIEKYVKVLSGYNIYKEDDNPYSAIVIEVLNKY